MSAAGTGAVGQSVPQLEGDEKLTGKAQYIADLDRPGMLHAAILQSPHAHARIRGYDLAAARALPGVRAIVTGDDLDARHRMGAFIKDEPAFARARSATSARSSPRSPPTARRSRAPRRA